MITSLQNDKVKHARGLQSSSKIRAAERQIVLEGTRLIGDALDSNVQPNYVLYTAEATESSAGASLLDRLQKRRIESVAITANVMAHIADTQTPQGWLAVVPMPNLGMPVAPGLILILSAVADPGNLGTILRTAAAAAFDLVIVAPGCVDPYNPKALRSGMGAHFRIPVLHRTWPEILTDYGTLPMRLADAGGEIFYTAVDWRQPSAVIIGGEANGADEDALRAATERIAIPMGNAAESLNAAVAAGVILFEARRQRML